ncbi:CHAT domain-containing protein [Qipengyuania flava]|uniref:CHAT domain-containing protein n=1 Tax=Qipengyuania flava TaxID=192812 RepID=UPI0012FDAAAD|nr:CHAT domain-containing protein [Qipengyuania flava]
MKTAMRSVIWGTVAAAVAFAAPSNAQSLEEIPLEQRLQILARNQQARPLMEVYGIATFAAGADESCQLFDVGELRAFQVLKGQIGRQLARVGGDEVVAAIDQTERGTRQAKGCAMPDDTKVTIERARVVARALQDAPAIMTTDQQQCAVEGTHWRFHRREWEFVPKGHFGQYDEGIALMLARHERLMEISPAEAVNSLLSASNAAMEAGRDDDAMHFARKAAGLARELPGGDEKALRGLLTLSQRLDESGQPEAALDILDEIETRVNSSGSELPVEAAIQRGLSQVRAGQDEGWEHVARARARIVDRMILDATSFELDADLENYFESILLIAETAIISDRADDALNAFELASWGVNARARQLARLRHSQFDRPDLAVDIDKLRSGTARLRLLARERAAMLAAGRSEAIGKVEREIADLERSVADAEAALRTALPEFDTTRRPADVSIETVQAQMGPDEALLIAMPAKRGLLLMAVTPETVVMKAGLGGRPTIRPLVERLRLALDAGEGADTFPFDDAKTLHDLVLPADIAAALNGKDRVSLVTSDALSRLPFSALLSSVPDRPVRDFGKMDWLVRHHAFATVLSPSAVLGSQRDGGNAGRFLGIGDPGNSDEAFTGETRAALAAGEDLRSLPSLPASREEVRLAGEVSGASERIVLIGDDATEARLRLLAGTEYSVVLFATHGLMEGELGGLREPALVLTPGSGTGGATDDGILHAGEIAELGLSTQIAILSACNTAAGRSHAAPAYTGLANAFLASGSERVMLSHWRVQDEAASQLTVEFVKRLRDGHAHAEALRLSQLSMLEDETDSGSANPARWASMVLIDGR